MTSATSRRRALRTALWHLRHGGVRQFVAHRRRVNAAGPTGRGGWFTKRGLTFDPWPIPERTPARNLRVGVVLDDFSRMAFAPEWQQILLKPSTWRADLAAGLDLVFIESAWNGNGGAWQYHLTGPTAPRPAVVELLAACRQAGVPTVFWNKEDPAHYNDFLDTARLFDRVYTTDVSCVPTYVEALGHDRVGVLTFAAQPAIHNPIRTHGQGPTRDVAFAGTYFTHKYPERREQMDLLLGAALDASARMDTGLEIFSRFQGEDQRYRFPVPFGERVVGSLDYPRMLTAYREYKAFLNVNSMVDSPSMCARRIFEIVACGTPVVTTPSAAVGEFFPPDEVFVATSRTQAADLLRAIVRSPELRERSVHLAQRRIWRSHTYGDRAQQVLFDVGLSPSAERARPSVTALVSTNRPHQVEHVLRTLGAQVAVQLQVALLTHGFELDEGELRARAKDLGITELVLLDEGEGTPLGTCLNRLVAVAEGDVVAKIDDDDLYGTRYLSDQLYALDYSGADVVGKQAHYMYLQGHDVTILRSAEKEHRFTDFVMGPTIVARQETARAVPFAAVTRGEDTDFLRRVVQAEGSVYSADRFGFIQLRRDDAHAWDVTDAELLASGEVQWYGRGDAHVLI